MALTTRYCDNNTLTYELLTVNVSPATDWVANDVITGQTSAKTCTVVAKASSTTYWVKSRNGAYTDGEVVGVTGNADKLADQNAGAPTFANDGTNSTYPWTLAQAIANAAAGDVVLVKAGTGGGYDRAANADTWASGAGTFTSPIVFVGADASWVPTVPSRSNGTGSLVLTNYPAITYTSGRPTMRSFMVFRCLSITNASYNGMSVSTAANAVVDSCYLESASTGASAYVVGGSSASPVFLINNDIVSSATSGALAAVRFTTSSGWVVGNRITVSSSNAIPGLLGAANGTNLLTIVGNTIYATKSHAISITSTSGVNFIYGNTCVNASGSSSGIYLGDGETAINPIIGNQITDNGAYGIEAADADIAVYSAYNRLTRNSSGADSGATDWLDATSFGNQTTAQAGADADAQRDAEYSDFDNNDFRLRFASYAKTAMLFNADIGGCQRPENTFPAAGDVDDTAADYGDVIVPTAATFAVPAEAQVQSGVQYGAGGTEYTGTLVAGGGGPLVGPSALVSC